MIRFCWVHVSFNFVVVESSSLEGQWALICTVFFGMICFSCKTIWNYMNQLNYFRWGADFALNLQLWVWNECHWCVDFISNCNCVLGSASTKLLSAKAWFRFGFQVTFMLFTKMTSGFPLSSPFKFSRSTFKRLPVSARDFISYMLLRGGTTSQRIEFSLH